jgi:hypothetical protein
MIGRYHRSYSQQLNLPKVKAEACGSARHLVGEFLGKKGDGVSPSLLDVVAPKKSLECHEGSAEEGAMSGKTKNM